MLRYTPGIRDKLIGIFVVIKVLPLIVLAWFAWDEIFNLASTMEKQVVEMSGESRNVVGQVAELSSSNSIRALDIKSRESIERLTTDTARLVASFLYDRDQDIMYAATIKPTRENYQRFLSNRIRPVTVHIPWIFDEQSDSWIPSSKSKDDTKVITAQNDDNKTDFHYRSPEDMGRPENRPIYLEITYVDTKGREQIKITTSDLVNNNRMDISQKKNTFCKAETYFSALQNLKPGEIYVSEVIGAYVKGHIIGAYNKKNADKRAIRFEPEKSGYAGKENPVGRRFQGLIRWGKAVVNNGQITGYVTLALDHAHIMEFTDYIIPTEERYSSISDASTGNYAFMWDYKGRNISHPRDYFIVGYDPETGEQAIPWLSQEIYQLWKKSNISFGLFCETTPLFHEQSLKKKPASPLTKAGLVALDGRFLNFAPQCSGWHNITQNGGSGSFLIFWSGLWKLTTAATIPYYTGQYGKHPRGFGYVTIGANVHEFHRAAMKTKQDIEKIEEKYVHNLRKKNKQNRSLINTSLEDTTRDLTYYTVAMIAIVIIVAILMASALTKRITDLVRGITFFQEGKMDHRMTVKSSDEMGQLATAFNHMADTTQQYITDIESSKDSAEKANLLLKEEITERKRTEKELSRHQDNLEELIKERTEKLEKEMAERKIAAQEKNELELRLHRSEKMEAIGTLAGGVAHDLNNILSGIVSYPELLLLDLPQDSPLRKPIQTIQRSGERAATIVQDLLTLARRGVMVSEIVNMNTIIKEYLKSPEHRRLLSFHHDVDIETFLEKDLLDMSGSPVHLLKTVMNLVSNAAEAMPGGGKIIIHTGNQYVDLPIRGYDDVKEGDYVTLSVTDSGVGILPEDKERIFEPFYTKKKMGRSGTGLGMAVVWGTVKDHEGYIDFESSENGDTIFKLYFPVTRKEIVQDTPDLFMEDFSGNGESILIADDVEEQREIASMILRQLGYAVSTVSSGEKAIEYLKNNSVDLLVLDMIMDPGIDGLDTYREVLKLHPEQKAVIVSGYTETDRIREAQKLGAGQYIKKPYSINKFGVAVKTELAK